MKNFAVLVMILAAGLCLSAGQAKWTLMFYMTAAPDIEDEMVNNLTELASVDESSDMNVIVEADWVKTDPCSDKKYYVPDPYDTGTSRYRVSENSVKLIKHLGEQNMGDVNVLSDFLTYCKTNYPADKYILFICGHGSGWESYSDLELPLAAGKEVPVVTKTSNTVPVETLDSRAVSYDDLEADSITIPELKAAIEKFNKAIGRKMNMVVFDSCLLENIETLYELKDVVTLMIGSEAGVLTKGVQYTSFLLPIKDDPNVAWLTLCDEYCHAYVGGGSFYQTLVNMFGGTVSSTFIANPKTIVSNLNRLVEELMKVKGQMSIYSLTGFGEVVRYYDVEQFCLQLVNGNINFKNAPNYGTIKEIAGQILDNFKSVRATLWTVGKYNRLGLGGLGIWWPEKDRYQLYREQLKNLSFGKDCLWDEFLDWFVLGTVRHSVRDKVKDLGEINNRIRYNIFGYAGDSLDQDLNAREQVVAELKILLPHLEPAIRAEIAAKIKDQEGYEEISKLLE
ncbi:MAG: clostripain-related cysteine peptidase [Candidatus Wallbacteria bacterium]|nr:clostripain-related cysteine peptidase [Candidatus Wallbacteria bacterium]